MEGRQTVVTAQQLRMELLGNKASEAILVTIFIIVCVMIVVIPLAVYWNYRFTMKQLSLKETGTTDARALTEQLILTFPDEYFYIYPPTDDMF